MNTRLAKILMAPWLYKQPLTRLPDVKDMVVSDLFIWRKGPDWDSYFDLLNLYAMTSAELPDENESNKAEIRLMNQHGGLLRTMEIPFGNSYKQEVDIGSLIKAEGEEYGTYCIFHPRIPEAITAAGGFLAERGYASFRYKRASLRSYVHGNLDAVAAKQGAPLTFLGSTSLLGRKYSLQYQLLPSVNYEVCLTNPAGKEQVMTAILLDDSDKEIFKQLVKIKPGGCSLITLPKIIEPARFVVSSHLVMARPIVFKNNEMNMDVFHG